VCSATAAQVAVAQKLVPDFLVVHQSWFRLRCHKKLAESTSMSKEGHLA